MKKIFKEISLKGDTISEGVSLGKLIFLEDFPGDVIAEFPIQSTDVEHEVARYRHALFSSQADLSSLERCLAREGSREAASIIHTHIQMLKDPFMTTFVEEKIRQMMKNTESVFRSVMSDYEKEFTKTKGNRHSQRLLDVKDLSNRILRHLSSHKQPNLSELPNDIVIFTQELVPSLASEATLAQVKGFVTEIGGITSHAALITRSKGIPYMSNIDIRSLNRYQGCHVIVDTHCSTVIVNPSYQTRIRYQPAQNRVKTNSREVDVDAVQTRDGCALTLLTNIESIDDVNLVKQCGAHGIGLFRSEFLYVGKRLLSVSEEEQYALYRRLMNSAKGKPLTFRLFDIGGDKGTIHGHESESNPALGCRAIRFLLRYPEMLLRQLRALIRVSFGGDLRILLPFISDVTEIIEAKRLIKKVTHDLREEGYQIAQHIPIGAMIEVPSAVIACDLIAKECDFFSIGTNDLTQYTLATDRTRQDLHSFYTSTHPSITRMIRDIAKEGDRSNIPVSVCGEMAAEPLMIPLLLGLGIRIFSCAPRHISVVREMARQVTLKQCQTQVVDIMQMKTCAEVGSYLRARYGEMISEIV